VKLPSALLVAAVAGLVGLAYEVLWFRALSHVTGNAPWAFGALLGAYLVGVAVSSVGARMLSVRRPTPSPREAAWVAGFVALANAVAFLVIPALATASVALSWMAALPLLGMSAGMLGAVLPLAAHFAIAPGAESGARLSYVYVADIVGSAAGSALTGYVLLDHLSTRQVSVVLAAVGFALAPVIMGAGGLGRRALAGAWAVAAVAAVAAAATAPALYDRLWERLQFGPRDDGSRFARVLENRHGVITVTAGGVVYGGGCYDGAFSTDPIHDRNGIFRAYAVAALHPAPKRVLLIGLGSGSWAQVLAHLPGVEQLTAVEINPGYLEVIREQPEVASLLENPRVELVIDDARRWLARHPGRRFDVIVSNVTLHWRAHSTNLLSREFTELVRAHLEPGGVYSFNTTFFWPARETALTVFSNGVQLGTFFAASDRPLRYDAAAYVRALRQVRIDGRPVIDEANPAVAAHLAQLSLSTFLSYQPVAAPRIITDDNMLPEWHGWPFRIEAEGLTPRRP
jgi:predicted membrane-bound spermidine synthase